jgi:soluble lytic murein transglycosylase-like protein
MAPKSYQDAISEMIAQRQMQQMGNVDRTNPWAQAAQSIQRQDFRDPEGSTFSNLGVQLAQGLAGGLFGSLGQQRQQQIQQEEDSNYDRVISVLQDRDEQVARQELNRQIASDAAREAAKLQFNPQVRSYKSGGFEITEEVGPNGVRELGRQQIEGNRNSRLLGNEPFEALSAPQEFSPAGPVTGLGDLTTSVSSPIVAPNTTPTSSAPTLSELRKYAVPYAQAGLSDDQAIKLGQKDWEKASTERQKQTETLQEFDSIIEQAERGINKTGAWSVGGGLANAGVRALAGIGAGLGADNSTQTTEGLADLNTAGAKLVERQIAGKAATLYDSDAAQKRLSQLGFGENLSYAQNKSNLDELKNARERLAAKIGGVPNAQQQAPAPVQAPSLLENPVQPAPQIPDVATPTPTNTPTPTLIAAQIQAESAWNPNAKSPVGAEGLTQFMPATKAEYLKKIGVDPKTDIKANPEVALQLQEKYMSDLLKDFNGDEKLALAAYNAGPGRVKKALKKAGGSSFEDIRAILPAETRNYVAKITDPTFQKKAVQGAEKFANKTGLGTFRTLAETLKAGVESATFNVLGDEARAAVVAPFVDNTYSQELDAQRQLEKQFRKERPNLAMTADVAGGIGGSFIPGLGAVGAVKKGGTILSALGRAAGIGAAASALEGEGGAANRIEKGAIGGLTGAGIAGAGKGLSAVASNVTNRVGGRMSGLSPEELAIAARLRNADPSKLQKAEQLLQKAEIENVPAGLVDVVDDANLQSYGRGIVNSEAGQSLGQDILQKRQLERGDRLKTVFDKVTDENDVSAISQDFLQAIKGKQSAVIQARREAASPLYTQAFTEMPEIPVEQVSTLLSKSPRVANAIRTVKKEFPELANEPDNSSRLLHEAKQLLQDNFQTAKRQGDAKAARLNTFALNDLKKTLYSGNELLKQADETFAASSPAVDKLTKGQVKVIERFAEKDESKAIDALFSLSPKKIAELKDNLGDEYSTSLSNTVKAWVSKGVDKRKDGKNVVDELFGSKLNREKLRAAVGDEKYNEIIEVIDLEQMIAKGDKALFKGSTTQSNQAEDGFLKRLASVISSPIQTTAGVLDKALSPRKTDAFNNRTVELLLNTAQGRKALQSISPLLSSQESINRAFRGGQSSVNRASSSVISQKIKD